MTKTDEIIKKIANKFVEKIENFSGEWKEPFFRTALQTPINVQSKKRYRGLNIVSLWLNAEEKGFTSNVWGTFDQWKEKGKSIRKGETGTPVFFFKTTKYEVETTGENGEILTEEKESCVIRYYIVFNACQMTEYAPEAAEETSQDTLEEISNFKNIFMDKVGIEYEEGKGRACYIPSIDKVYLPSIEQYLIKSEYIPTACHEFIHASGAKHRLNRDFSGKFGDESYAFEELVADIGAGFLSAALGKKYIFQNNNIAYLKSWTNILKDKPRAILQACSQAQKAADYLLELAEANTKLFETISEELKQC